MAQERLDKILVSQNIGSRKQVGVLIRRGLVQINGVAEVRPEQKVNAETDAIAVNGQLLGFSRYIYLMLNKPKGVLSAARDSRAPTVVDLVPPELQRPGIFPAGRLDKDTEGLLILTNDGEFAHKMLSPKKNIDKIYHAVLDIPINEEDKSAFAEGIKMKDFQALPAQLSILHKEQRFSDEIPPEQQVCVCIREGKYHQVKRMFAALGKTVLELRRVRIGSLVLDPALAPGQVRRINDEEILAVFT